jgi:hypothetical protein
LIKVDFDDAFMEVAATKIADRAFEKLSVKLEEANKWPPMLGHQEIKQFFGCGTTLASQLMNRADFPRVPDVGRKCVPLHLLYLWIDKHSEWVQDNTNYFERRAI